MRFTAIAAFVLLLHPAANAQVLQTGRPSDLGFSSAALERIAPTMRAYVDSGKVSGMVMLVARHGKVVYSQAIGTMDAASGTPMRTDAVFRIYSMTKPVTAVAILKLYDAGKLRLDDPVSKYIPSFANAKVYAGGGAAKPDLRAPDRAVTIRDLLTHTAGLTYGFFGSSPVDTIYQRAQLSSALTTEQFADSLAKLPLLFSPGTKWNYSYSIDILGRVVEVASGQRFDVYLEQEIFAPLGMRETSFRAQPYMEARVPVLYNRGPDGKLRVQSRELSGEYGATAKAHLGGQGLLSTAADYLRFAQMLANGGELDGRRLLAKKTVDLMMTNVLPASQLPIGKEALLQGGYGQGLGGAVLVDSASAAVAGGRGIYRWLGAASTYFWVDRKNDLAAVLMSQFWMAGTYPMDVDFQRLVYSALVK